MSVFLAATAGTVLGLGILAKPIMLAFVPVVIAALTYVMVRDRWRPRAILSAARSRVGPTRCSRSFSTTPSGELVAAWFDDTAGSDEP